MSRPASCCSECLFVLFSKTGDGRSSLVREGNGSVAARLYHFLERSSNASFTLIHAVESKYFTLIMLAVVVANTTVMIFETYDEYIEQYKSFFLVSERIFLCIYVVECSLKLWVGDRAGGSVARWESASCCRCTHGDSSRVSGTVSISSSLSLVLWI